MEAMQTSPPRFNYLPSGTLPRTLDDLRMVHDNYATSGSFSASSMRPMLIAALVIAAGAGIVVGVNKYSEYNAAKISAAATAADPGVPSALSVPATSSVPAPSEAVTAKDSPVTDPVSPPARAAEVNSMPLVVQGNTHASESTAPVKARSNVAAKAAVAPVRNAAPMVVSPAKLVAPQPEVVPLSPLAPPAPLIIEEKPVVLAPLPAPTPAPVPDVPPVEPPKL